MLRESIGLPSLAPGQGGPVVEQDLSPYEEYVNQLKDALQKLPQPRIQFGEPLKMTISDILSDIRAEMANAIEAPAMHIPVAAPAAGNNVINLNYGSNNNNAMMNGGRRRKASRKSRKAGRKARKSMKARKAERKSRKARRA